MKIWLQLLGLFLFFFLTLTFCFYMSHPSWGVIDCMGESLVAIFVFGGIIGLIAYLFK